MPRQARIDAPGALHHIIIRGIERKALFRDQTDRDRFVERLGTVVGDTATTCYAWALMTNHVHLLLMTGNEPIATVMRRLLTGYAQEFNRRYNRHGQLFQNRYKSILCEKDSYMLELVRYIHLNPVRARITGSVDELKTYRYTGHAVLMGTVKHAWQDQDGVLRLFHKTAGHARRKYHEYVSEAVQQGRRPELVGGGLLRSIGGWKKLQDYRKQGLRIKADERILGSSDFVAAVLKQADEALETRTKFEARGHDVQSLLSAVGVYYKIEPEELRSGSRQRSIAQARSVVCYIAVRQLGMSCREVSRELKISPSAVSNAVVRGKAVAGTSGIAEKIVKKLIS